MTILQQTTNTTMLQLCPTFSTELIRKTAKCLLLKRLPFSKEICANFTPPTQFILKNRVPILLLDRLFEYRNSKIVERIYELVEIEQKIDPELLC